MAKICSIENCNCKIFSKGLCLFHWKLEYAKPIAKSTKGIKVVTDKLKQERSLYSRLREKFLLDNPVCMARLGGCTYHSTEVHHKKGRGKFLCVVKYFLGVCRNCHDKIGVMSIVEAVKRGFSLRRNTSIK